jgi:hypothetical protein
MCRTIPSFRNELEIKSKNRIEEVDSLVSGTSSDKMMIKNFLQVI